MPDRSIVALDIGVLLWFSRLYVADTDAKLFCPGQQLSAEALVKIQAVDTMGLMTAKDC